MTTYLLRRLLLVIPVMLGVTFIVFFVMRVVPGDPAEAQLGEFATPEQTAALREEYDLDRPLPEQYLRWVGGLATFDLGLSLRGSREPVADQIVDRLPVTLELAVLSIMVALLIGVPTGVISAVKQGTILDYACRVLAIVGLAVPTFVMASLLVLLPAIWWGWSPPLTYRSLAEDWDYNLRMFAFPAIALGATFAGTISRMVRSQMLEVLRHDYVRTAHAKGLKGNVVLWRHAMRNAWIPVFTLVGLQLGVLLGGTVITESIFGLPGLGRLMLDSITARDYQTIQGVVLFMSVAYVLVNIVVDVSYGFLDPRIRTGRS